MYQARKAASFEIENAVARQTRFKALNLSSAFASIRVRFVLIPPAFLCVGIVVAIATTLANAPGRVGAETTSGMAVGTSFIDYSLDRVRRAHDAIEALRSVGQELSQIRHIRVGFRPINAAVAADLSPRVDQERPPEWFVNWLARQQPQRTFEVYAHEDLLGELILSAEPADEASEIWLELVFLICLLSIMSVGIAALTYAFAKRTLKPLDDLAIGLDRLQRGQFDAVADIGVAELHRICAEFNRLARSLARTERDNRYLIERLMSVQESERKELARELHDEFGASLFGIRAAASCILNDASTDGQVDLRWKSIVERATDISSLADNIQRHNYRIIEKLQPSILSQLGLYAALEQLVASWKAVNRTFTCGISLPNERPSIGETAKVTIYRIVQESLTNVARHSKGTAVQIDIYCENETDALGPNRNIVVSIEDDGIGIVRDFTFGFGFLSMNERVRNLAGVLTVAPSARGGTLVVARIPLPLT